MNNLTKKQKEILFECWKNAENTKERLKLIEEKLPLVNSLIALNVMRKLARTDPRWIRISKKNKQEKEMKRIEMQKKREEREKLNIYKNKIKIIREKLSRNNLKEIEELTDGFVYCNNSQQFVSSVSCIFRLFSNDFYYLKQPGCDSCFKFNKYISSIEDIINETKKKS